MNKVAAFCLLFLFFVVLQADDEEYLKGVRLEPAHGVMNYDGSIDIFFDLPKDDLVEKVYLSHTRGVEEHIFSSTEVSGSKLGYLNNSLTLTGSELYNALEKHNMPPNLMSIGVLAETNDGDSYENDDSINDDDYLNDDDKEFPDDDKEVPDDDVDVVKGDKSWADKEYEIKLVVELDTSGNDKKEEEEYDDFGNLITTPDDNTVTVPEKVVKTVKITFDNIAPEAPEIDSSTKINPEGGDKGIVVHVTPPVSPDDGKKRDKIGKYYALLSGWFEKDGEEVQAEIELSTSVDSDSYDKEWSFSLSGKDGYSLINNDESLDKYIYKIKIYAEDLAGNSNPSKYVETEGSAITTFGYWKSYKEKGGKDDGGFCFIATAGFGSYFSPQVKILRNFRDIVLMKFSAGRKFVKFYYDYGKYPADIISKSAVLKATVRTLLFPFVLIAWLFTETLGHLILMLWFLLLPLFFVKKKKIAVFVIFIGTLFFNTGELQALGGEFSFTNSFYYPSKVDKEADNAFKEIGGSGIRYLPSLTFGFALPVLENYIRWSFVGGIGYTRLKGTAIKADGTKSSDRSVMHFIPIMGETKIRPAYKFPLWPYATFGIDYYVWWVREKKKSVEEGGTFGFHGSFGLMLSLNWLDDSSSRKMEEMTGIKNSSLFVQYRLEKIDDFGKSKSFDLSSSRFEFGIVFEF
ncbi:MAG: MXAN_2562 family outer membrane beta-barrel protein [bacterium]